jgi:hypothetical protein
MQNSLDLIAVSTTLGPPNICAFETVLGYARPCLMDLFTLNILCTCLNIYRSCRMQNVERRYLAENQGNACGQGNRDMDTTPVTLAALAGLWIILAGSIVAAIMYSVIRAWCCLPRGKAPATSAVGASPPTNQSSASTTPGVNEGVQAGNGSAPSTAVKMYFPEDNGSGPSTAVQMYFPEESNPRQTQNTLQFRGIQISSREGPPV